jgi:hypothetical protein
VSVEVALTIAILVVSVVNCSMSVINVFLQRIAIGQRDKQIYYHRLRRRASEADEE